MSAALTGLVLQVLATMEQHSIEADDVTFHSLMKNASAEYVEQLMSAMKENGRADSTYAVVPSNRPVWV